MTAKFFTGRARFLLMLIILSLPLLWRVFWIHPLFVNATVREQTRSVIVQVTEREGWLLSDVHLKAIENVEGDWRAIINHRQHLRGTDPTICWILRLSDVSIISSCYE